MARSYEKNIAIDYAMRNRLVCSAALIMGSKYTDEAIELAFRGEYIQNVHCHLNLSLDRNYGKPFVPLNEAYKKSRFCKNGEFASVSYYHADFLKHAEVVFQELEAQYLAFKEKTRNQANYLHVDFHNYSNMSPPVAVAYERLIKKYHIQSARFFGEHQTEVREAKKRQLIHAVMMFHWRHCKAYVVKSSRIEYFLVRKERFQREKIVELFVHPDYRNGMLIDKTESLFGNEMKPLEEQISSIKQLGNIEFVSWVSLNK